MLFFLFIRTDLSGKAIGPPEFFWGLTHPVAAVKVKIISHRCNKLVNREKISSILDSFSSGGKADAFRHIYFMAAFSQKVKPRKVRKLGEAHEKTNYRQFLRSKNEYGERPDSLSGEMDLRNNELGIRLGRSYRSLTLTALQELVINEINAGKAFILKRNVNGAFVTCGGHPVDLKKYAGVWHVPKCLVASSTSNAD